MSKAYLIARIGHGALCITHAGIYGERSPTQTTRYEQLNVLDSEGATFADACEQVLDYVFMRAEGGDDFYTRIKALLGFEKRETIGGEPIYVKGPTVPVVEAVPIAVTFDVRQKTAWHSVKDEMPEDGRHVLVRGDSGVRSFPYFLAVAHRDSGYQNPWRDAGGTALADSGYRPTHWRPLTNEDEGGS